MLFCALLTSSSPFKGSVQMAAWHKTMGEFSPSASQNSRPSPVLVARGNLLVNCTSSNWRRIPQCHNECIFIAPMNHQTDSLFLSLIVRINCHLKIYPLFYLGLLFGSVFTCVFHISFTDTTSFAKLFFLLIVCYWPIYITPVFGKYLVWLGKYITEFPRGLCLLGMWYPISSWCLGTGLWQHHVGQLSLHLCQICSSVKDIL